MIYDVFGTSDSVGGITTAYAGGFSKSFRVYPGPIAFIAQTLVGPTSLDISIDFAASTAVTEPSKAVDADWYSLVDASGALLSPGLSIIPANVPAIIDLSSRNVAPTGAVLWDGKIPNGASWIRLRLKRTGSAVTALSLKMLAAGPAQVVA